MKKILASRGCGKTTALIALSAITGGYIVAFNHEKSEIIASQAREQGINIQFPITYDEFMKGQYYGKGIKGFLIDDVDLLIKYISHAGGVPIIALTMSIDED